MSHDQIPLKVSHLWASYEKQPVIYDINFEVKPGVMAGIIGPNGAGKSTLLKSIVGLIPKSKGSILIFGKSIKKGLKRISYIPQKESVDWHFPVSVYDVVMMGRYAHLGLFKRPSKRDKAVVWECLKKLEIDGLAERQISHLSGGQQQRTFIARALAQESDLYFMDEPFSGIDAKTETIIVDLLHEIRNKGKSVLVIHHDLSTVKNYFDHVLLLNRQIITYGPTENHFSFHFLEKTFEGNLRILTPEKFI